MSNDPEKDFSTGEQDSEPEDPEFASPDKDSPANPSAEMPDDISIEMDDPALPSMDGMGDNNYSLDVPQETDEDTKPPVLEFGAEPEIPTESGMPSADNIENTLELDSLDISDTESLETQELRKKLKEAYYEIGRSAESAGDRLTQMKQYEDAIKFYKNALNQFNNGESQLKPVDNTSLLKAKKNAKIETVKPVTKFGDDNATGYAAVLNYNLASSTSVALPVYQEIDIPIDWFHPQNALHSLTVDQIRERINSVPTQTQKVPKFQINETQISATSQDGDSANATSSTHAKTSVTPLSEEEVRNRYYQQQASYWTPEKVEEMLAKHPRGSDFWQQFEKGHPLHKYSFKSKEGQMKADEVTTLELRRAIRDLHNQIKEATLETLKSIEELDDNVHAGEFNKSITEIAKILREYQKYDPYSYISKEREFLEGQFKQIPIQITQVAKFVDELIDKLKQQLPRDRKIERDNRISAEVKRYSDELEETGRQYQKKLKDAETEFKRKMAQEEVDYEQRLKQKQEEIEDSAATQKQELNEKLNAIKKKLATGNNFVQKVQKLISLAESVATTKNRLKSLKDDYAAKIAKTRHYYYNNKGSIKTVYRIRLTPYNYNGFIKVYSLQMNNLKRRNQWLSHLKARYRGYYNHYRRYGRLWWGAHYKTYAERYERYEKEINKNKKNMRKIDALIKDVKKKQKLHSSHRRNYLSKINSYQRQLQKLQSAWIGEYQKVKKNYPNLATSVSQLKSKYGTESKKIRELQNEKKQLELSLKDIRVSMQKEFEPLYEEHYQILKGLKADYQVTRQNINEELAKTKVELKKKHETNIDTIRTFYLQFLPDEIRELVTTVDAYANKIEEQRDQIKSVAEQSIEIINNIHEIADRWNYTVLCNRLRKKKKNVEFADDLEKNRKVQVSEVKHIYSLVLTEDIVESFDDTTETTGKEGKKTVKEEKINPELFMDESFLEIDDSSFDLNIDDMPVDFDIAQEAHRVDKEIIGAIMDEQFSDVIAFTGIPEHIKDYDDAGLVLDIQVQDPNQDISDVMHQMLDDLATTSSDWSDSFEDPATSYVNGFTLGQPNSAKITVDKELIEPNAYSLQSKKVGDVFVTTYFPDEGKEVKEWPTQEQITHYATLGYSPRVYSTLDGDYEVKFIKTLKEIDPTVYIIYEYTISSFLGDYGAGKTIKTFSLLPGESTTISIKTWKTSTSTRESAQSVLESSSKSAAKSFSDSVSNEFSRSKESSRKLDTHTKSSAKVKASVKAGWGPVKAEASASGSTSKSRKASSKSTQKQTAKNISNAVSKHASTASSNRSTEVQENSSESVTKGQERGVTRELKNINLSRVLNFVFRQLNQEYITLIHVTNIKLAFSTGFSADYIELPLHELDDFVNGYFREGYDLEDDEELMDGLRVPIRQKVKKTILESISTLYDYRDRAFEVVEPVTVPDTYPPLPTGDYRFKNQSYRSFCESIVNSNPDDPSIVDKYEDVIKGHIDHGVNGIVVDVSRYVMRTDAIVIDAFLGKGMALDDYALSSQIEALREKQLQNAKMQTALNIINMENMTPEEAKLKADLYYKVFGMTPLKNPFEKSVVGVFPEVKDSLENLKL